MGQCIVARKFCSKIADKNFATSEQNLLFVTVPLNREMFLLVARLFTNLFIPRFAGHVSTCA